MGEPTPIKIIDLRLDDSLTEAGILAKPNAENKAMIASDNQRAFIIDSTGTKREIFPAFAAIDPTVNDDVTKGYVVGQAFTNTVSGVTKICNDNTTGAAVWLELGGGGLDDITAPQTGANSDVLIDTVLDGVTAGPVVGVASMQYLIDVAIAEVSTASEIRSAKIIVTLSMASTKSSPQEPVISSSTIIGDDPYPADIDFEVRYNVDKWELWLLISSWNWNVEGKKIVTVLSSEVVPS